MKSMSLALLAVIMSSVVLVGCMGAKPTEEVMVDTGTVVDAVVETTVEEVVPTVTTESGAAVVTSESGAAEVVNQVVNEVTTAQ